MAGQQRKKKKSTGPLTRPAYVGLGYYAGHQLRKAWRNRAANKAGKTISKIAAVASATKKAGRKVKRWKATHGKIYTVIGKSGGKIGVHRRGISAVVSTVKRRRSTTRAWRTTTRKAGPAARAAFKKAPRNVVRGKVRSPSYAITRRR